MRIITPRPAGPVEPGEPGEIRTTTVQKAWLRDENRKNAGARHCQAESTVESSETAPPFSCQAGRKFIRANLLVVVTDVSHSVADRPGAHFFCGEGTKQLHGRLCRVAGRKPPRIVAGIQYHRHAIVDGLHDFIGAGGKDGEGFQRRALSGLPTLPESSKGEGFAGLESDGEGLFRFGANLLPLVKAVGGHQAAALFQGLAEGGLAGGLLGAGVEGCVAQFGVPGPEGHQTPALQGKLPAAATGIEPHHGLNALRGDVVARRKEGNPCQFHIEPSGKRLRRGIAHESAAHTRTG